MLARLARINGVGQVLVDMTGQTFLLAMGKDADADAVVDEALRILGPDSYRLESPWQEIETDDLAGGGVWLAPSNIRTLSLLEARMLSAKWGGAAARAAGIGRAVSERLVMSLREELAREFRRVHDAGGAIDRNWYRHRFPDAFRRAVDRLAPELDGVAAGLILESLQRQLSD